jgi:2'-5' RNA ligase
MRVFVAMDVPEEVRQAIAEYLRPLAALKTGARWARVEGMHVTLKFIGASSPEGAERIKGALSGVQSSAAVQMKFRGTGFFPNAEHPRVFWAGIEATPNLLEIAVDIEKRLQPLGIAREQRAFHPHLTLARLKDERGLPELRAAIAAAEAPEFGACSTGEFHLYESVLKREGAQYARLATFPFAKTQP